MRGSWGTSLKEKTSHLPVMQWSRVRCTDSDILRWAPNLEWKGWYFVSQWKWKCWPPLLFLSLHLSMLQECLHTKQFKEYFISSFWKDTGASPESDTQTWYIEVFLSIYKVQLQGSQIFLMLLQIEVLLAFIYLCIWATTRQKGCYSPRGDVGWKELESHLNTFFCKLSPVKPDSFWNT